MKIGPVVSVENSPTNGNFAATRLQFDDRRPFVMLAFENQLECGNSDFSVFGLNNNISDNIVKTLQNYKLSVPVCFKYLLPLVVS